MSKPSIVYVPRPGVTPEREVSALAAVYRYALDRTREKRPAKPGAEGTHKK